MHILKNPHAYLQFSLCKLTTEVDLITGRQREALCTCNSSDTQSSNTPLYYYNISHLSYFHLLVAVELCCVEQNALKPQTSAVTHSYGTALLSATTESTRI